MPSPPPDAVASTAWSAAIALLARRDLSEGEVRERLRQKGHDEAEIGAAVSRLQERGHLDDRALARSCARTRHHGPLKAAARLRKRQIPEDLARWAIREEFGEGVEAERARAALARLRKNRRAPTDGAGRERERLRLHRGLIARGFSREATGRALGDADSLGEDAP